MRPIVPAILILLAAAAAPPAARAQGRYAAVVERADRQYSVDHDYEAALGALRAALDADSTSYDLLWRIARATTDRGARAEFDGDRLKAKTAFDQAARAARRAVTLEPNRAEGRLELAVALGRLALHEGGKEKVRLSREIGVQAERALEIDPKQDRAHHVLGRWNRGIATLNLLEKAAAKVVYGGLPAGATMDAAVTHFEQAIALRPGYANHHLELGRTYLMLKLRQKARVELEKALAAPPTTPFDADYRREAKKLLAEAGGR